MVEECGQCVAISPCVKVGLGRKRMINRYLFKCLIYSRTRACNCELVWCMYELIHYTHEGFCERIWGLGATRFVIAGLSTAQVTTKSHMQALKVKLLPLCHGHSCKCNSGFCDCEDDFHNCKSGCRVFYFCCRRQCIAPTIRTLCG